MFRSPESKKTQIEIKGKNIDKIERGTSLYCPTKETVAVNCDVPSNVDIETKGYILFNKPVGIEGHVNIKCDCVYFMDDVDNATIFCNKKPVFNGKRGDSVTILPLDAAGATNIVIGINGSYNGKGDVSVSMYSSFFPSKEKEKEKEPTSKKLNKSSGIPF